RESKGQRRLQLTGSSYEGSCYWRALLLVVHPGIPGKNPKRRGIGTAKPFCHHALSQDFFSLPLQSDVAKITG
ncbi:MAG TPA: hypothetical protein VJB15_06935, partial [Rhodothermia bacterium]|nr:hypothetical protein [Rhodothermia bacterium]